MSVTILMLFSQKKANTHISKDLNLSNRDVCFNACLFRRGRLSVFVNRIIPLQWLIDVLVKVLKAV